MSFTANPFFFTLQKHYELFILLTKNTRQPMVIGCKGTEFFLIVQYLFLGILILLFLVR